MFHSLSRIIYEPFDYTYIWYSATYLSSLIKISPNQSFGRSPPILPSFCLSPRTHVVYGVLHTYYDKEHPPSTAGAETSQDPDNQDHHPHNDEDDGRGAEELIQVVVSAVQLDDFEEFLSILRH